MITRFPRASQEIPGSDALIVRLLHGPWDGDFVVARAGETISYLDFRTPATGQDGPPCATESAVLPQHGENSHLSEQEGSPPAGDSQEPGKVY